MKGYCSLKFVLMGCCQLFMLALEMCFKEDEQQEKQIPWEQREGICLSVTDRQGGEYNQPMSHISPWGRQRCLSSGAISRTTGTVRLWEMGIQVAEGVKQASCLCLAPSLGQISFPKGVEDFTITRDYSIAACLMAVVPSQERIIHRKPEGYCKAVSRRSELNLLLLQCEHLDFQLRHSQNETMTY